MCLHQILIGCIHIIQMEVSSPSQIESLEVQRFNIDKQIHLLNRRVELIDLDIAARTEEIAVLNDFVDDLIFMIELLVKFLHLKHLDRLLQVCECVEIITVVVIVHCEFLVLLRLVDFLLLVKRDFRAEQAIPVVFSRLSGWFGFEFSLNCN